MATKLSTPIEVSFWDGNKRTFSTYERLLEWIEKELEFIADLQSMNGSSVFNDHNLNPQKQSLNQANQYLVQALQQTEGTNPDLAIGLVSY